MRKIIIIGAGASGMTCAIRLKQLHKCEVILLEAKNRIGKKILQTGNGKCNISNINTNGKHYNNPEFINRCLENVSIDNVINFFNKLGLIVKVDEEGRVYPYSESATTVIEVFRRELDRLNIVIKTDFEVIDIVKKDKFIVKSKEEEVSGDVIVFATGSLAQSNNNGYDLLKNFNHTITQLYPGLVSLKTKRNLSHLQGIRVKCNAEMINGSGEYNGNGEILFKKDGLSGILALDLSRFYQRKCIVELDLMPQYTKDQINNFINERINKNSLDNILLGIFPKMIVHELLSRDDKDIVNTIKHLDFEIVGLNGYEQAQITVGGVSINELNDNFSSKLIQDLYIIGEVLDIDGACGGFNLSFAWISGLICANSIAIFEKN